MIKKGASILASAAVLGILCAAISARADDRDHERAYKAVRSGEILPLSRVLPLVREAVPGEILEVEIEREHGKWIYEIEVLRADGRVVELHVDGRSGHLLREDDDREHEHEDHDDD